MLNDPFTALRDLGKNSEKQDSEDEPLSPAASLAQIDARLTSDSSDSVAPTPKEPTKYIPPRRLTDDFPVFGEFVYFFGGLAIASLPILAFAFLMTWADDHLSGRWMGILAFIGAPIALVLAGLGAPAIAETKSMGMTIGWLLGAAVALCALFFIFP
ncbi:hypothetical protein KQI84_10695 [bacterium]|nr:hypothetical protein [bacterium]